MSAHCQVCDCDLDADGTCPVCKAEARIAELQQKLADISAELDEAAIQGTKVVRIREGGGPEDLAASVAVTIASLERQLRERDEAVRVLGARVKSCEHMLACYRVGRRPSDIALDTARETADAVDANPIASAALADARGNAEEATT